MFRSRRLAWTPCVVLGAVALLASCSGETPTDSGGEPVDQEPRSDALTHLISDPVPSLTGAAGASASAVDVSYVSLPPGTYPQGETATITNLANDAEVNATMVEGGFDPVPVPSAVGDTLLITIKDAQGETIGFERATVPPEAPPLIVRTRPTKSKVFVPLNLVAVVVFSEPVDRSTVSARTIQIRLGGVDGAQVAGTVALQADGLIAEFIPAEPLESGTEYALVVTTGIRDLAGDALPNMEVVFFKGGGGVAAYVSVDWTGSGSWAATQVAVIDIKAHALATTIDFPQLYGNSLTNVMFVPDRPVAYLSGSGIGWVDFSTAVIDADNHARTGSISGLESAQHMTMSLDGRFAYAIQGRRLARTTDVVVVSTENHEIVRRVSLGTLGWVEVYALAVSPDGSTAYAATQRWNGDDTSYFTIEVIDMATNSVVATRRMPGPISRVRFSPDGKFAYASNVGIWDVLVWEDEVQSLIYVIDTANHHIVATIETDRQGEEIVITPDGAFLFVSSFATGDVTVIATATNSVIDRIGGMRPGAMLLSPDGSRLYTTDSWWNTVWVIDVASRSVITGVSVAVADPRQAPFRPPHLAVTPDGAFVYVAGNAGTNTVVVIDTATNTVVAEIDVGGSIRDMAIGPR